MTTILCSNDPAKLTNSDADFRVLLYGSSNQSPAGLSIGNTCIDAIKHLDTLPDQRAFDFLSIALSIVAADSFVLRKQFAADGFSRLLELEIAVGNATPWRHITEKIEVALNFLTGDKWLISFQSGGERAPSRIDQLGLRKFTKLSGADSVCLFSGGLDSLIGATDLTKNRNPVLVSRASTGDQVFQERLALLLPNSPRFSVNDSPVSPENVREISTRARSILFLALGGIVCSALSRLKGGAIPLTIPENGFIALNPPLNMRRIGANSTRTAHPYYLSSMQEIFSIAGIPAAIENPYRFVTKGEMLVNARDQELMTQHATKTVSCGHWKRKNMQCGRCWPCVIRRAAFLKSSLIDTTAYQSPALKPIIEDSSRNADLCAALYAIHQFDKYGRKSRPVRSIRYLPSDAVLREKYMLLIENGFEELREFFFQQEVWS